MRFLKYFMYACMGLGVLTFNLSPKKGAQEKSFPEIRVPKVTFGQQGTPVVGPIYQMGSLLNQHIKRLGVSEARAATGDSVGDTTYYPTDLFSTLKQFMDPLPNPNVCDSAGEGSAMIASVNCHLTQDIGVEGIGTYSNDMDGGTFTVHVNDGSSAGYDYYVEAWVDFGSNLKFMNYWLDGGGQRGKMEVFPQLPGNQSNTFALSIEWDSTDITNKSLTVIMEQVASAGNTWGGRQMAMKLSGTSNENTGNMELNGGVNMSCGGGCQNNDGGAFDLFKIQMVRNSSHTIAQGEICNGTAPIDCANPKNGAHVCFKNSDSKIVERDGSGGSFSNLLVDDCNDLVVPSGSVVAVDESTAGLFHDGDDDLFELDTGDTP